LAAFLLGQLEAKDKIQSHRRGLWNYYDRTLAEWATANGIATPTVPVDCEQSYHMYYLVLPSLKARQALIAHLKSRNIYAVFHYLPLHLSEMGRKFGGKAGDCPVTEDVSDRLLRLPFYNDLTSAQQQHVVKAIIDFDPSKVA
jgi:dTDP-4-amino-4,6-dideoxygalactose transaminase